jgi:type IV pilus assembly protein PilA
MVKTSNKGFTLVELMIVIAIIGVLAAALFPMMRGYLEKSRDTARISHLGQLRTVVQSYLQDTGNQPIIGSGAGVWSCAGDTSGSGGDIAANLNGGLVPADPVAGRVVDPCSMSGAPSTRVAGKGLYGYFTGDTASSNKAFFIVARVESSQSSTTGATAATGSTSAQIDSLLMINGQKGIAATLPTSSNNGAAATANYGVYLIGGMN